MKDMKLIFTAVIIGWIMISGTIICNRVFNLTSAEFVPVIVMDILTCLVLLIISIVEYANTSS